MVLIDIGGNWGATLAIIGLVLWIAGVLLPKVQVPIGELAPIGKMVFLIGIVLFIILLVI